MTLISVCASKELGMTIFDFLMHTCMLFVLVLMEIRINAYLYNTQLPLYLKAHFALLHLLLLSVADEPEHMVLASWLIL